MGKGNAKLMTGGLRPRSILGIGEQKREIRGVQTGRAFRLRNGVIRSSGLGLLRRIDASLMRFDFGEQVTNPR